jgi:hypothetical protein
MKKVKICWVLSSQPNPAQTQNAPKLAHVWAEQLKILQVDLTQPNPRHKLGWVWAVFLGPNTAL